METARQSRDKFLGEGAGMDRKWQGMLNQYNKQLEDKGKDPITMDQFKEIMDNAVQKLKKQDLETSDTAARLRTGVQGQVMGENAGTGIPVNVSLDASSVNSTNNTGGNPPAAASGTNVSSTSSHRAQPRAAQKAGNPEYIWP